MSGSRSADIPDTTASLVATARKAQADGWPPLSPHALTPPASTQAPCGGTRPVMSYARPSFS